MINILISLIITVSLILLTLNHPLRIGLILILQTLIVASVIGYILSSFFFSYIIIIIILRGALVLFIYIASIASNEKFKSPVNIITISFLFIIISMVLLYYYNPNNYNNIICYSDYLSLIKTFNIITAQLTIIMIIYLLFTIIVVSNIAKTNQGPLRIKT